MNTNQCSEVFYRIKSFVCMSTIFNKMIIRTQSTHNCCFNHSCMPEDNRNGYSRCPCQEFSSIYPAAIQDLEMNKML